MAQVIKVGDESRDPPVPPQIVTSGVIVEYSFPDNTYSVKGPGVPPGRPDKTNFWQYVKQLFGVKLEPNKGLTGKSLSGTMDPNVDGYFIAEGIPLTDVRDQDAVSKKPYPFQIAHITVKDANSPSVVLAQIDAVAPVSTELMCANCHSDDMDATQRYVDRFPNGQPTGKVETNILAIHDVLNRDNYAKFLAGRPDLWPRRRCSPTASRCCAPGVTRTTPWVCSRWVRSKTCPTPCTCTTIMPTLRTSPLTPMGATTATLDRTPGACVTR